eukprot:XP_025002314.1 polyadenylate-binding protein 2 isoform X2 [Gallus gallus]
MASKRPQNDPKCCILCDKYSGHPKGSVPQKHPKNTPKTPQKTPKYPKMPPQKVYIPKMAPKGPQNAPSCAISTAGTPKAPYPKNTPKYPQNTPKYPPKTLNCLKWPSNGPITAPKWLQNGPKTTPKCSILCDKYSGHPKGFAYIEFSEKESVRTSMALDESLFRGRQIKVIPKRTNRPGISTTDRGFPRARYRGRGGGGGYGATRARFYSGYSRPRGRAYRGRARATSWYSPY